jgi:hypothetical protein
MKDSSTVNLATERPDYLKYGWKRKEAEQRTQQELRACCSACPGLTSYDAEQAQNWGCLPSPYEINEMLQTGKVWMCHSNPNKPCIATGLAELPNDCTPVIEW